MRLRSQIVAAWLVLLGLGVATLEEAFIHTDDGCEVEVHCNACLLRLGTTGVVAAAFSLPVAAARVERVAPPPIASFEDAKPEDVPARGPPLA